MKSIPIYFFLIPIAGFILLSIFDKKLKLNIAIVIERILWTVSILLIFLLFVM